MSYSILQQLFDKGFPVCHLLHFSDYSHYGQSQLAASDIGMSWDKRWIGDNCSCSKYMFCEYLLRFNKEFTSNKVWYNNVV